MKRIIVAALLIALLAFVGAGCGRNDEGSEGGSAISGSIKIAGSTTVLPLSQLFAEKFMDKYPDASISVSGGGSGVGISSLINGSCDIANASREAKKKELDTAKSQNTELTETRLCKDGLAIVVNSSNNLTQINMSQLAGIYSGKISNWKQVGGNSSGKIVAVGRDSSSGTFGYFQEAVLGDDPYKKDMLGLASNQAVAQAVAQSPDAIGYVGIAYAESFVDSGKVKMLSVSREEGSPGILPSDDTIKDGSYPLFRYLLAYTMGKPSGLAAEFLKFCTSEEGQAIVPESGYMPL